MARPSRRTGVMRVDGDGGGRGDCASRRRSHNSGRSSPGCRAPGAGAWSFPNPALPETGGSPRTPEPAFSGLRPRTPLLNRRRGLILPGTGLFVRAQTSPEANSARQGGPPCSSEAESLGELRQAAEGRSLGVEASPRQPRRPERLQLDPRPQHRCLRRSASARPSGSGKSRRSISRYRQLRSCSAR